MAGEKRVSIQAEIGPPPNTEAVSNNAGLLVRIKSWQGAATMPKAYDTINEGRATMRVLIAGATGAIGPFAQLKLQPRRGGR